MDFIDPVSILDIDTDDKALESFNDVFETIIDVLGVPGEVLGMSDNTLSAGQAQADVIEPAAVTEEPITIEAHYNSGVLIDKPQAYNPDSVGAGLDKRFSTPTHAEDGLGLSRLQCMHQEIVRLLATGMKPKAIAASLDVHINTVSNVRRSPMGIELTKVLHYNRNVTVAKSIERVQGLTPLALDVYEDILTNPVVDLKLKHQNARDILKGSGVLVDRQTVLTDNPYLSEDDIIGLKQRYKKSFDGDIEDAVVTDLETTTVDKK